MLKKTHGKEASFAVCMCFPCAVLIGTRQRWGYAVCPCVCRMLNTWHTANRLFAVCLYICRVQHSRHGKESVCRVPDKVHTAKLLAHGKEVASPIVVVSAGYNERFCDLREILDICTVLHSTTNETAHSVYSYTAYITS